MGFSLAIIFYVVPVSLLISYRTVGDTRDQRRDPLKTTPQWQQNGLLCCPWAIVNCSALIHTCLGHPPMISASNGWFISTESSSYWWFRRVTKCRMGRETTEFDAIGVQNTKYFDGEEYWQLDDELVSIHCCFYVGTPWNERRCPIMSNNFEGISH